MSARAFDVDPDVMRIRDAVAAADIARYHLRAHCAERSRAVEKIAGLEKRLAQINEAVPRLEVELAEAEERAATLLESTSKSVVEDAAKAIADKAATRPLRPLRFELDDVLPPRWQVVGHLLMPLVAAHLGGKDSDRPK